MSQDHRLQLQRFELKYLVDESIIPQVRQFVSAYLELDEYSVGRPNSSYPVHSLYFDSDDLKTFHASINGVKNRFKLRIRYYNEDPDTPMFFEIKARVDNCILKQRCGVRRDVVPLLAAGQLPSPDQLYSKEGRHLAALQRFHFLQQELNARPKAHNCYMREAWVTHADNSVRVTFDRQVQMSPCFHARASTTIKAPARAFPDHTIIEIKFTNRFPNWLQDLVESLNLVRTSASKYVQGILAAGEYRFHDGYRVAIPEHDLVLASSSKPVEDERLNLREYE